IRLLSFAIIHSTTKALPIWRSRCNKADLKANLIPRDVVTRWNSTHDMLRFVVKYRKPIKKITGDKKLPNFRKYRLEDDEWTVVEELVTVLERYKQATLFFSRNSASVFAVIPAMDKLDSHMSNVETKEEFQPAIRAAMKLARKKMDRYWKMTDDSNTYRIATVLHPGLKLEYFR
ncbi:ribonuclease H-like domain-containing protein, partial [Suillus variegatus]